MNNIKIDTIYIQEYYKINTILDYANNRGNTTAI